jgi:hypothetical protein
MSLNFLSQLSLQVHFLIFYKKRHDLDTVLWQIQAEKHLIIERGTAYIVDLQQYVMDLDRGFEKRKTSYNRLTIRGLHFLRYGRDSICFLIVFNTF